MHDELVRGDVYEQDFLQVVFEELFEGYVVGEIWAVVQAWLIDYFEDEGGGFAVRSHREEVARGEVLEL